MLRCQPGCCKKPKNKPGFNFLNPIIPLSPLPLHYLRKYVIIVITTKDLAPIDYKSLELWRCTLKHRKDETLYALYAFCQDFFAWVCLKHYMGDTCDSCKNYDYCQRCKLTMVEVKNELVKRRFPK